MTVSITQPSKRRTRTFHRAVVAAASPLTPRMRRITLGGEELATYTNEGPATHFKLVLPGPGQAEAPLPQQGPDGPEWPDGRPIMRTYTPRYVDAGAGKLVIDFSLHPDGGPATQWAASAAPGDRVVVTEGRGAYRVDPEAGFTVLVADETAVPAVATILEDAPQGARVLLYAEVPDTGEHLEFDTASNLTTTWLDRDGAASGARAGEHAAAAVRAATFPPGPGRFWVGLEAAAMRTVRRHLLGDRGTAKDSVYTRAYWKDGTAGHRDGDRGEDVN